MTRPKKKAPRSDDGHRPYYHPGKDRWRVRNTDGSERWFRTEDDANAYRLSVQSGRVVAGETLTVGDLATMYLAKRVATWDDDRIARRQNVRRHLTRNVINDPIAGLRADRLTVDDVETWQDRIVRRCDPTKPTLKTYRGELNEVMNWAVLRKLVAHNPVPGAEWPRLRRSDEKGWLNLDEAHRLVEHCAREHEPWGPYLITTAMLGLRPGETAAITRSAVDFDAGTVAIYSGIKRDGGKAVLAGETKTRSTRILAAPPEVMSALRRQCEVQDMARLVYADVWPERWGDLLFLNSQPGRNAQAGVPPHERTIRNHLARICTEADIPTVTPYELRHSCASILLHRKIDPHAVAAQLGTSVAMLRHHYGHLIDPVLRDGVDVWTRTGD